VHPTLKSYSSFNYVEKNSAKALKVTMNISRKMLYYIALHYFTADDAIAPARTSFKIQSCIFRFCIFRNIGPANPVPVFSGCPFSAPPTFHLWGEQ